MNLQQLKQKNPAELINEAEKLGIENPSTLRKQEILFSKIGKSNHKERSFRRDLLIARLLMLSPISIYKHRK